MLNTILIVIAGLVGVVVLLFVGLVGCIYFLKLEKHFRTKTMASLAGELDMVHDPRECKPDELGLPTIDLYRDAGPCRISNIMKHESESQSVWAFDVFCSGYYIREGLHRITVIALSTSAGGLPNFSLIYKDGYLNLVDGCEGIKGLEFEHCWDLTSLYLLRSEEPNVVSTLLTESFTQAFGSLGNCSIECHAGWLFVYRPASTFPMSRKDVVQRIERALTFLGKLEVMTPVKSTSCS